MFTGEEKKGGCRAGSSLSPSKTPSPDPYGHIQHLKFNMETANANKESRRSTAPALEVNTSLSSGESKGLTLLVQGMLSVSSLNIISSHETSFSSLARGSSRCWESSRSLYLLLHTPLLPASCRDKELRSPGASSPSMGSWGWGFGPQGAGGLGMGLGMTGFTPKRNLIIESTALWRDFLPAVQGQAELSGRRLCKPHHHPREVSVGLLISHLTPWVCQDGQEDQDTPWENQDSSHCLQGHKLEKMGSVGQPLPPSHSTNCIEGLGVCKAGGWNKMAAAKSSLKHPKLLMCMKARQHPFRIPEGTKARAAPLSHSAGATCCSLNSARNVAGMKVALPARVLREPKSKDCQVKRVKPPRTAVSDWLYIISIASSTGIII